MNIIAYCLMLILAGWGLRGAYGGAWRGVRDPHRLQDPEHFWLRRAWVEYAFTIEQLTAARQRAKRMTTPWQRWRPLVAYLAAFALLALVALLSGCNSDPAKPPPVAIVAPTGPQTEAQLAALGTQLATEKDLAQRAAGAVYGAGEANAHNPAGLPREATAAQIAEAASALPPPTAEQQLAKADQNARILAGELAAVKAEMGQAIGENERLRGELAAREAALASLERAAAQERATAAAKLQRQFDEFTAAVTTAQLAAAKAAAQARNQVMQAQVRWLNRSAAGLGGLAVLALGLATFFGGFAAVRGVAPFAGICLLGALVCFGLAQIVGQAWFMWTVAGAGVLGLLLSAWWIWRQYQAGVLATATQAKAAQLKGVLTNVVPVLDAAYEEADAAFAAAVATLKENGSASGRKLLDELIFSRLSTKMDATDKAAVHQLRAEEVTAVAPAP